MIRIGILGDIGAGKSYVAKNFGYPVFNADEEVAKIYSFNRSVFNQLKKSLPDHFKNFPIDKKQVSEAILAKNINLKKIIKIIHKEVRKKLKIFLKTNSKKKIVILDIPLLLENKINSKRDVLVFVYAKKYEIQKRLKKRKNFNSKIFKIFKNIQLPLDYKKRKSNFVIKNNFKKRSIKLGIRYVLNKI